MPFRGSLFGITRFCGVMQIVIQEDGFFYPHQTTMVDSFSCIHFDVQNLILT